MSTCIIKASVDDLERINDLYSAVKADKAILEYSSWGRNYPTLDTAKQGYEKGGLFFIEEDKQVVASFSLNGDCPPEYEQIDFGYNCKKALCVHTLCTRPGFEKRGLASMSLSFTKQYAKENGFDCVRLDTYIKNKPALGVYLKNGFEVVCLHPFCFDRKLTQLNYVLQFIVE